MGCNHLSSASVPNFIIALIKPPLKLGHGRLIAHRENNGCRHLLIDDLVQDCSKSSALAMKLL